MKKRGVYLFIICFFIFCIVSAQEEESDTKKIDKAYDCLKDQIEKGSLSLQDATFSLLALSAQTKIEEEIKEEKSSKEECWPKSGCKIKDTAQILVGYSKAKKDTTKIKEWLLSKTIQAKDLIWYLEIDITSHTAAECSITYDSKTFKITVKEDMTLDGNPGGCLKIAYNDYWLQIEEKCFDKEFKISCNNDFIATLAYHKKGGTTIYVTSDTKSSSAGGDVFLKVNSKCFSTGTACDYEGTLWALLALKNINEKTSTYLPYLLALADENKKYLPSAFLYILGQVEKYDELISNQKGGKYWDLTSSPYNRFYDTALALLAISNTASSEAVSAQNYLLSVQTKEGCWNNNNIRDTAFILFANWPKEIQGGTVSTAYCTSAKYFCEEKEKCLAAEGNILDNYICSGIGVVCCSKRATATCEELKGLICNQDQECTGNLQPSLDGSCCVGGGCINKPIINLCKEAGGICVEKKCLETEEQIDASCPNYGEICCKKSSEDKKDKKDNSWIWILILSIFILLILIAIIFRKKIQMWIYSKKLKKGMPETGPRGPPPGRMPPGTFVGHKQTFQSPQPAFTRPLPPQRPQLSKTPVDKEFEETMKKLKEMSK